MATIDKLTLDIEVKDKTVGESSGKKIRDLSNAISRLDKTLKTVDFSKMSTFFTSMTTSITPFIEKLSSAEKQLTSLSKIVEKFGKINSEKTPSLNILGNEKKEVSVGQPKSTQVKIKENEVIEPLQIMGDKAKESQVRMNQFFSDIESGAGRANIKFSLLNDRLEKLKEDFSTAYGSGKDTSEIESKIVSVKEQMASLGDSLKDNRKEVEKTQGAFSKLTRAFGRIALYRAIRSVIKQLTQTFKEGMSGIAAFSDEFRQTMSQLSTSSAKFKASVAVGFYQIVSALTPTITNLSDRIVEFANNLSLSIATIKGSGTYLKVNTEYWKEYNEAVQGTLLSFDTFETLGKKSEGLDFSELFRKENVSDATDKQIESTKNYISALQTLKKVWETISDAARKIWGALSPIASSILNVFLKISGSGVVSVLLDFISKTVDFLDKVGLLDTALWGIVGVWGAIKGLQIAQWVSDIALKFTSLKSGVSALSSSFSMLYGAIGLIAAINLVSNWKDMSTVARVLTGAVIGLSGALFLASISGASLASALTFGIAGAAVVAGIVGMVSVITDAQNKAQSMIKSYEFGGGYKSADLFYANENGKTELVASNNSGGGGSVMNISQWEQVSEQAFLNALYKYGAAQNGKGIQVKAVFDGAEVARSKGFTGEMNRKNPHLKLV